MTMNKDIKERWVKALRSGEYAQTNKRLHDKNGYCCLGVLTDLYLKETNQSWGKDLESDIYNFQQEGSLLAPIVYKWAEIYTNCPFVSVGNNFDKRRTGLASLNDNGSSFEEIATLIENDGTL